MTKPRRLACSMLSVVIALTICAVGVGLLGSERAPRNVMGGAISVILYETPFCVVGWLLALPLILRVDTLSGRRIPAMLLAGSLLGPLTIYLIAASVAFASGGPAWTDRAWSAISYVQNFPRQDQALRNILLLATAISVLTTAIYVLSIRHSQHEDLSGSSDLGEPGF